MLYFFHHYELPVILQQAQLQQLLLRSHHGMGGMVGLAGIAAMASGAAYHDAPGTGTQATPPTTQSTTQTVQNTAQSTTQTSPSVSTAQTNTTHTGDVVSARPTPPETIATGTNTNNDVEERAITPVANEIMRKSDSLLSPSGENHVRIEEIVRKISNDEMKVVRSSNSSAELNGHNFAPSGASQEMSAKEAVTLDRRRDAGDGNADDTRVLTSQNEGPPVKQAPRASPEDDDLD